MDSKECSEGLAGQGCRLDLNSSRVLLDRWLPKVFADDWSSGNRTRVTLSVISSGISCNASRLLKEQPETDHEE